ncbi:MAG: hypothetical protein U0270_30590 [Labilithrix sp.]
MQSSQPLPMAPPPSSSATRFGRNAAGVLLIGLLVGAVVAAAIRWTHEEPLPTTVTDSELALSYRFAESEATSETKGKRATILGHVASVGSDEAGAYLGLARGHVRAYVRADQRVRAGRLAEGMTITTTCRVEGRGAIDGPVIARDCTIDEASRPSP